MIESPLSRWESKILIVATICVAFSLAVHLIINSHILEHKHPVAPPVSYPPVTNVTKGFHLVKVLDGKTNQVRIYIIQCVQDNQCQEVGSGVDPNDKDDVANITELYNEMIHPPTDKILQVIN
ncbi:MAG: hypothetical protein KGI25_08110 [Thaumarchaeota archaeon]|nr:hypothetical protein [Nitrososphaerota archaeon]